jgi:hypothetical protein
MFATKTAVLCSRRREEKVMKGRRTMLFRVAAVSGAVALLFSIASVADATPSNAVGCRQANALNGVFPSAWAIVFDSRTPVRRITLRDSLGPGACATWQSIYRFRNILLHVSLTLYRTHKQARFALSNSADGPIKRLANGALMRTAYSVERVYEPKPRVRRQTRLVVSLYRNVLISSESSGRPIDLTDKVSLKKQIRLHLRMDARIRTTTG